MKSNFRFIVLCVAATFSLSTSRLISGDKPPEDVDTKKSECRTEAATYPHGALSNFHNMLCTLNVHFPGMAEEFLYKLVVKMGMNPDTTALATDGTPTTLESKTITDKDGNTKTVGGTVKKVVAPSTFVGTYDYQATISVDGVDFSTIYWSGSASASKGFLILGGKGLRSEKHILYVKWDRTTTAQSVAVIGARMASTYLATPVTDEALYGKVTYNTSTKATTIQMVNIGQQRGASPSTSVFACWKMYASGTAGGAMVVGKTNDALSSSTGHADTSTAQDGIVEMDDWEGTDSVTTANGTGNGTAVQGFAMDYSCNDLKTASATGRPFDGSAAKLTTTKTEMDTMFSAL